MAFRDGKLTMEEGDNLSASGAEAAGGTKEIGKEGEERRVEEREPKEGHQERPRRERRQPEEI